MTQEEKQLLLQDLCGRLPYGVICEIYNEKCAITEKLQFGGISHFADDTICLRPYLRPLSSMTEEEKNEHFGRTMTIDIVQTSKEVIDWLNKKHFDYRHLIERGLALEVTEENNPYKE